MSEPSADDHELEALFEEVNENLKKALRSIWSDPALQSIQSGFGESLQSLREGLESTIEGFKQSEAGQQFLLDLKEFNRKVQSGELEAQVRDELVRGLRKANQELADIANRATPPQSDTASPPLRSAGRWRYFARVLPAPRDRRARSRRRSPRCVNLICWFHRRRRYRK